MRMRCIRPSRRRRCPLLLGADTANFCASLVEGLMHLESTLDDVDGGGVSMRWCADAMRLVKRMQREMLVMFRKADVPAAVVVSSRGGGAGADCWFEHYMQQTAALLDFCNAFKAAVSRMHRYCMVVDFATHLGGRAAAAMLVVADSAGWAPEPVQASPATDQDKLSGVKAVVAEAERLGRTIVSGAGGDDAGGGMVVVTLVAKITTSILSTFVLQALSSPSPLNTVTVQPKLACAAVPELEPWRESLSLIHARFPSRATVAEHEQVAMAVQDLITNGKMDGGDLQEEPVIRRVELLRARSGELREGVELFDCVLDEVFDEVIWGRNEMLGILRDKALT